MKSLRHAGQASSCARRRLKYICAGVKGIHKGDMVGHAWGKEFVVANIKMFGPEAMGTNFERN